MVEISCAKKRRGTASLKGRTNGGPPKAYWPGLEIDEYDKKNTNNNNNNINIGSYNNNNSSSNDNSNSIMQRTNGILHTKNKRTGDGKSLSSPRQMDVVVNSNAPIPSTTTKENNTNGTSSFRPKRRKRKRCVPPTDKKVEAQQQQQNQKQHHQMIVDEEEKEEDDYVNNGSRSSRNDHSSKTMTEKKKKKTTATKIILTLGNENSDNVEITSTIKPTKENLLSCMGNNADENNHTSKNNTIYEEAEGNNVSCLPPNTNNSKELERTISTTTSASNASSINSSSSNTSVCTATIANDGNKCTNTSPLFGKNDEPQTETIRATTVGRRIMTLKDTTMATMTSDAAITVTANPLTANATATTTAKTDMVYHDDTDAKMEMKTPTALAGFLLRKKLPVIDETLSNIRDVLLGMVSPSLQNRITTTSGGTMSHSCSNSNSSKNNLNVNVNSTKQSHNQHEEEEKGEVVVTSKFHDVCEQQEKFLERMERIELAAAKREEEFLKRTTEEAQNRREENLVTELKRHIQDKSKYQSEIKEKNRVIKDLKESKRSTQRLFQSRLDEQFRELSKRETENEKLRKRIAILEQSSKKSNNSTVSTTTNHVSDLIAACQGGGSDR